MFCIEQYKQQTDTLCVLHLILIYSNALAIICRQAGRQGEGEKDRERERERERESYRKHYSNSRPPHLHLQPVSVIASPKLEWAG